jgi:N-methylhydantoinase A/oxoprolinase/acetone carboxylase beta subunit
VVLVHIRLAMVVAGPSPRPVASTEETPARGSRPVRFGGEWVETPVLRGEPAAGAEVEGPVVFELPEATFVVPPGWSSKVDEAGTILAHAHD